MYSHIRARHASLVSKLLLRHTFWLGVNQIHLHVMLSLGAVFQWFWLNKFAEDRIDICLLPARTLAVLGDPHDGTNVLSKGHFHEKNGSNQQVAHHLRPL